MQDLYQSSISKSIEKVANISYFDNLNSWFGQNLQRDCPSFDLEIIDHNVHGTCIRFCPLELGFGASVPDADQLEHIADCIEEHIEILRSTVKQRGTLKRLVEKNNILRLVTLSDWQGLGGVRFVPEGWETLLTDQAKTELNKLNTDLVESLRATDNAFSMGEAADGLICIRWKLFCFVYLIELSLEFALDLVWLPKIRTLKNCLTWSFRLANEYKRILRCWTQCQKL